MAHCAINLTKPACPRRAMGIFNGVLRPSAGSLPGAAEPAVRASDAFTSLNGHQRRGHRSRRRSRRAPAAGRKPHCPQMQSPRARASRAAGPGRWAGAALAACTFNGRARPSVSAAVFPSSRGLPAWGVSARQWGSSGACIGLGWAFVALPEPGVRRARPLGGCFGGTVLYAATMLFRVKDNSEQMCFTSQQHCKGDSQKRSYMTSK